MLQFFGRYWLQLAPCVADHHRLFFKLKGVEQFIAYIMKMLAYNFGGLVVRYGFA
jgi:hypothetical protein